MPRSIIRPGSLTAALAATLAIVGLLLFASTGSAANAAVSAVNYQFSPTPLTISVGTTVVWTNNAVSTPHTVTADDGTFNSGNLNPTNTFTVTFNTPGTYNYHCQYHGSAGTNGQVGTGMAATIIVQAATTRVPRAYLPIVLDNN